MREPIIFYCWDTFFTITPNKRDKAEREARSLHSFRASGCCERQRATEDLELKFLLFIWGPQTLIEIRLFNESILIIARPDFTVLA